MESRQLCDIKRRGLFAAMMIKDAGQPGYSLAVCLGCDVHKVAYLSFEGTAAALNDLYTAPGKTPVDFYNTALKPWLRSGTVKLSDTSTGGKQEGSGEKRKLKDLGCAFPKGQTPSELFRKLPQGKGAFFVNLVMAPQGMQNCTQRIKADTTDKQDGGFCFSLEGPDKLLVGCVIPPDVVRSGKAAIERVPLCVGTNGEADHKADPRVSKDLKVQYGSHLVVVQDKIPWDRLQGRQLKLGGKLVKITSAGLLHVPRMNAKKIGSSYSLLTKASLWELSKHCSGIHSAKEFDKKLQALEAASVSGYAVTDYRRPSGNHLATWVSTYEGPASPDLTECPGCACLDNSTASHFVVDGTKFLDLAAQLGLDKLHVLAAGGPLLPMGSLNPTLCHALHGIYSKNGGYGSRGITVSAGHNTYTKQRRCNRPLDNVVCGPSNKGKSDYWRKQFRNPHALVATNPAMNEMARIAMCYGNLLHHEHLRLVERAYKLPAGSILNSICTNGIFNMGHPGELLLWASSCHTDSKDRENEHRQVAYRGELQAPLKVDGKAPPKTARLGLTGAATDNLLSWGQRFGGFSRATSCGYADVGDLPPDWEVFQFFVMEGLGLSARLGPGVSQSFFGAAFCHNTAVTLALNSEGKVVVQDPKHYLVAWGGT